MKMGVEEKPANSGVFGGKADAMNMAWTARHASTMVRALSQPPNVIRQKGDP
jgi:hypothetical protein